LPEPDGRPLRVEGRPSSRERTEVPMTKEPTPLRQRVGGARDRVMVVRARAERTLLWRVWDRMLEIEFVDRGVALAGKAFVSFFPLVIVVASFAPPAVRTAIFSSLTHRLGIAGAPMASVRAAFASADDTRKATGVLGLVLTIFFASSFTTALQRVFLRVWRRPAGGKVGEYARGPTWFLVVLASMAVLGGLRALLGEGPQVGLFLVVSCAVVAAVWWFTAWFMLMGQVRWRVLVPTGVITAIVLGAFGLSAAIWMPGLVTRNEHQYGFFGVALSLVTWFTGAATCVMIGACAGAVFAEDRGWVGSFIRGGHESLLVEGAPPSLPAPEGTRGLRDAFQPTEDEVSGP
jgi:membrane protein